MTSRASLDTSLNSVSDTGPSSPEQDAFHLDSIYDIPVQLCAVLGQARMSINSLLKLGRGSIIELDRNLGEPIDLYVNNRPVARGEIVVIDTTRIGITITEIIKHPSQPQ
jgi:flagellar motor switch protein FliN/FliY